MWRAARLHHVTAAVPGPVGPPAHGSSGGDVGGSSSGANTEAGSGGASSSDKLVLTVIDEGAALPSPGYLPDDDVTKKLRDKAQRTYDVDKKKYLQALLPEQMSTMPCSVSTRHIVSKLLTLLARLACSTLSMG
jgi:hypothetical protein